MDNVFKNWPEQCNRAFREFGFTKTVNIENAHKLDFHFDIELKINNSISIKNYTSTIKDIIFVYILIDRSKIKLPDNDYISRILPKTKTIEVGLNLNFKEFITANDKQAKQIMIDKFLWGIENLLSKRKDFDYRKFYDDCKKILITDSVVNEQILCLA